MVIKIMKKDKKEEDFSLRFLSLNDWWFHGLLHPFLSLLSLFFPFFLFSSFLSLSFLSIFHQKLTKGKRWAKQKKKWAKVDSNLNGKRNRNGRKKREKRKKVFLLFFSFHSWFVFKSIFSSTHQHVSLVWIFCKLLLTHLLFFPGKKIHLSSFQSSLKVSSFSFFFFLSSGIDSSFWHTLEQEQNDYRKLISKIVTNEI